MTACRSSGAVWVTVLASALSFCFAQVAIAQVDKWDPDVPGSLFKDGQTKDKKPKTTHRLAPAPPECPECQAAVDALQAALDDWYAMQIADADALKEKWKSDWHSGEKLPEGVPTEGEVNKQKDAAMEGLGHPADSGKAAKKKQTDNAKDKKDTHGTKGKLKDEIKRLTDALKKCLEDCKKPKEEVTPTPTPKDGKTDDGTGTAEEAPPPLPNPITLPTPLPK